METEALSDKDCISIGGCFLGEKIATGRRGPLFRGYQADRDREVAVRHLESNPSSGQCVTFDRRVIGTLKHANIVSTYAYTQVDMQAYLITRFIDGYCLSEMLAGTCDYKGTVLLSSLRGEWRRFAKFAADVASGLHHAHEQGIFHGNLNPSNLMLDHKGHAWITDFGWAQKNWAQKNWAQKNWDEKNVVSNSDTAWYDAPERASGELDPRSDIYSLGVTLYQIASGSMPVDAKSDAGYCDLGERLPVIPAPLSRLIEKACAASPNDRYQTASEMQVVFDRYAQGHEADRRKRNRLPNHIFRRRRRRKRIVMALVASFALSAIATRLYQQRRTPSVDAGTSTVSGYTAAESVGSQRDTQTPSTGTR